MKPERDEISGQQTTGHEWNGIKELSTPMPKAFSIWLWLSIAVAALLWILYPSFPSVSSYAGGVLGYSSRTAVTQDVADGRARRAEAFAPFETMSVDQLAVDASLRAIYEDEIAVLYRDNCAVCHGRSAMGQTGFPNLADDHWLWSGTPEEIEYTLQVGINSRQVDARYAEMPAFGRDEMLDKSEGSISIYYAWRPVIEHTMNKIMGCGTWIIRLFWCGSTRSTTFHRNNGLKPDGSLPGFRRWKAWSISLRRMFARGVSVRTVLRAVRSSGAMQVA